MSNRPRSRLTGVTAPVEYGKMAYWHSTILQKSSLHPHVVVEVEA
jgi:hypothetical protein